MNTILRKLTLFTITAGIACSTFAGDLAGTYRDEKSGQVLIIKELGTHKYSVTTDDWDGVAFWDKQAKAYEGVFRYKDAPKLAGKDYTTGGKFENAVGYHHIELKADGSLSITYQWGLSEAQGRGTFEAKRVK